MDDITESIMLGVMGTGIFLLCLLACLFLYSNGLKAGKSEPIHLASITKASDLCNSNGGLLWINHQEIECGNHARFTYK